MTKSDVFKMQHQFLDEFRHTSCPTRRKALLETIKSLEKVAATYKEKSDDLQGKPLQDPKLIDPINAVERAVRKVIDRGDVAAVWPSPSEMALLKEAVSRAI